MMIFPGRLGRGVGMLNKHLRTLPSFGGGTNSTSKKHAIRQKMDTSTMLLIFLTPLPRGAAGGVSSPFFAIQGGVVESESAMRKSRILSVCGPVL
jgi:hypothetical protein